MSAGQPPSDPEDQGAQEGTHPFAIVGAAAGVVSILVGPFCCLDPRLAGVLHTALGLLALASGGFTLLKVRRGQIEGHNTFQARLALGLGAFGLLAGIAWIIWWILHPDGR